MKTLLNLLKEAGFNSANLTILITAMTTAILAIFKQVPIKIFKQIKYFIKSRTMYTIQLQSLINQFACDRAFEWIRKQNFKSIKRALRLQPYDIVKDDKEAILENIYSKSGMPLGTFTSCKKFTIISISVTKDNEHSSETLITINIFGLFSKRFTEDLLCTIGENRDMNRKYIEYNTLDSMGGFTPSTKFKRKLNTIYLENKNEIFESIDIWKKSEDFYRERGIPYKLGILLYGEPGTGKSSLVHAIASELNKDVIVLTAGAILNGKLSRYNVVSCDTAPIIVIEEIDTIVNSRQNELGEKEKVILSELLNFLDGPSSPDSCIIIATTNHIEKLDPAIIRSGRFDIKIHMGKISRDLAIQMCLDFNCNPEEILHGSNEFNPSELQSKLIFFSKNRLYKNSIDNVQANKEE